MLADYLHIDLEKELGLEALPPEERAKVREDMESIVMSRINREILERLSDEEKQELDRLLDSDGDVSGFYRRTIPEFDLMVAEIVASFKEEMLGLKDLVDETVTQ